MTITKEIIKSAVAAGQTVAEIQVLLAQTAAELQREEIAVGAVIEVVEKDAMEKATVVSIDEAGFKISFDSIKTPAGRAKSKTIAFGSCSVKVISKGVKYEFGKYKAEDISHKDLVEFVLKGKVYIGKVMKVGKNDCQVFVSDDCLSYKVKFETIISKA
jgi:hypothetical protein